MLRARPSGFTSPGSVERLLTEVELDYLRRGDLIFWQGHVAIVRDEDSVIHANAHHMAVEIEDFAEACRRIRRTAGEITSVKRLFEPPIDPAFLI